MLTKELADRTDYAFNAHSFENRIQHFIDWQWEEFLKHSQITARNYIFWANYEN